MKHLRTLENYNEYKVGDYILIKINYKNIIIVKGKIVKITPDAFFSYRIIYDDGKIDTISKNSITRLLTPDEIEDYKAKIQAIKYNL